MAGPSSPTLPPNLFIFSPPSPASSQRLFRAKLFTRLTLSPSTTTPQLAALTKDKRLAESHTLLHHNGKAVLIFDAEVEGGGTQQDLEDVHHEQFREVCLALRDADVGVEVSRCVHDARSAAEAGFQLEKLSSGDVMVIDLMAEEDDDDDDDDDDESDDDDDEGGGGIRFETTEEVGEITKP